MDVEWLAKLYLFTDLCSHLNELNIKLQGVNKTQKSYTKRCLT
jgi:hypothetical protein